jgi:hypothetical protein
MLKKNKPKKNPTLAKNNTSFKWWAVPPKKGPLSQGLNINSKKSKKA